MSLTSSRRARDTPAEPVLDIDRYAPDDWELFTRENDLVLLSLKPSERCYEGDLSDNRQH